MTDPDPAGTPIDEPQPRPRLWRRGPEGVVSRRDLPALEQKAVEDQPRPGRASLPIALKLGFRDAYDSLGAVLLMSAVYAFLSGVALSSGQQVGMMLAGGLPGYLPLLLSASASLLAWALVGGPLMGGMAQYCRKSAAREEPELFDLAWGFRHGLRSSWMLSVIQATAGGLLFTNAAFYLSQRHPALVILGCAFGYLTTFWLLCSIYQWPLLIETGDHPLKVVRKSALIVLDNFPFTLALGLLLAVLSVGLWVSMVGGILLWAGGLMMLQTQATRELLRKYALLPPDPTLDPIVDEVEF